MLMRIGDATGINLGITFYRYYPELNNAYDVGEVTFCDDFFISVDFGDTLVQYAMNEISYVINEQTSDEHYMVCSAGKILQDYRQNPHPLNGFEDQLSFDFQDMLDKLS